MAIDVFVGCGIDEPERDLFFESVSEHCSGEVRIRWLNELSPIARGWNKINWKQEDECYKFLIPELMRWQGRAVYIANGYLLKADLKDLIHEVIDESHGWNPAVGYDSQVVVINCPMFRGDWWFRSDTIKSQGWNERDYLKYLKVSGQLSFGRHPEWNCTDKETLKKAKIFKASLLD